MSKAAARAQQKRGLCVHFKTLVEHCSECRALATSIAEAYRKTLTEQRKPPRNTPERALTPAAQLSASDIKETARTEQRREPGETRVKPREEL